MSSSTRRAMTPAIPTSVTLRNATMQAMRDLQDAMDGAAEEVGLRDEEDVIELVRQVRAEKRAAR